MLGARTRTAALAIGVTAAVACAPGDGEDLVAATHGAQSEVQPEAFATIEEDLEAPDSSQRVAHVGGSRVGLTGPRASELVVGRRYGLTLAAKDGAVADGSRWPTREVVAFRPVFRLYGTVADDREDASAMVFSSLHGKSYAMHGDTVAIFKEIRASLPRHDYSHTLFEVNLVKDREPARRFEWLDYTPVPRVRCTEASAPDVHLDLIDVKPDESLLDGFVATPIGGNESRMGVHVECARDGATYACALDDVGAPAGTARFIPSETRPFELVVRKPDDSLTPFTCSLAERSAFALRSED